MRRSLVRCWSGLLPLVLAASAHAVSCTTQSQMTAAERSSLEDTALAIARNVQQGDVAAVKAQTSPAVAAQFAGIADSIEAVQPSIEHATLTADDLYALHATDASGAEPAEFFCSVPASALIVTLTIPHLPAGNYALAIVHATGVEHPQQISLILSKGSAEGPWQLAGFFVRPMTMGGHDGVWFWQRARMYAAKKQPWNAWFYYQAAEYLLDPVNFLSSPNLQRLESEANSVEPEGLPGESAMRVANGSETFAVTGIHPGELGDHLDLVVRYRGTAGSDPVAERAQVVAVMQALLRAHPEFAAAFQGLWVYAVDAAGQSPFALELPMNQIESAAPSAAGSEPSLHSRKQTG